jgi:hypothetical protein
MRARSGSTVFAKPVAKIFEIADPYPPYCSLFPTMQNTKSDTQTKVSNHGKVSANGTDQVEM